MKRDTDKMTKEKKIYIFLLYNSFNPFLRSVALSNIERVYRFIVFFLLPLLFFSCAKEEKLTPIPLPPTPIASLSNQWGVVTSHFLRIREHPQRRAKILAHIRRGTLVEIITKSTKPETVENVRAYWYQIDYRGLRGWVFGGYIREFDSRAEATKFAESLK